MYTHCAWDGGTMEFSRIIDRVCWSCAFSLIFHVCLRNIGPNCWAFAFSPLIPKKLIVVRLIYDNPILLLTVSILHLKCVLRVWRHDNMGVVVECNNQQRSEFIVDGRVAFLALR